MKKSTSSELCQQCTTLSIYSKGGESSKQILIPNQDKLFYSGLIRGQLLQTSILSEILFCYFFAPKNKTCYLVQIAHAYQTLKPHPHIALDIVNLSKQFNAEGVVLCSTPIGSFLPKELILITGEVIDQCNNAGVKVLDHVLFQQNTYQCISLLEDEMLDYCHDKYKAMIQSVGEK